MSNHLKRDKSAQMTHLFLGTAKKISKMRITGGKWAKRKISTRTLTTTRPTTDRAREGLFNALESRKLIEGRNVLDLYAGFGGLGFEALSRGACSCIFIDNNKRACETIKQTYRALRVEEPVRVIRSDVYKFLSSEILTLSPQLIFVDPPYDSHSSSNLISHLASNTHLDLPIVICLEITAKNLEADCLEIEKLNTELKLEVLFTKVYSAAAFIVLEIK